ncbi:MAG TPA: alpha/beta hydrolase [Bellilinea sp.]|nr:alpha/beta hydrolase [Bellilinea sp.]
MHPLRFFGFIFILVLLVVLVGPLVIPFPPLLEPLSVSELADPDGQFIEVNGIQVHYKMAGTGEPVMILLHGFGASTYTWHKVMEPLADRGTVIAFDRPAFGLTERPAPGSWTDENPYTSDFAVKLTIGLMDQLDVEKAILIGHSAGAGIAVQTALTIPERVNGLVLVDPAMSGRPGMPDWLENTPQMKRLGPYLARSLAGKEGDAFQEASWHDFSKFTEADKEAYRKPLQVENWDVALWEFTKANQTTDMTPRLSEIKVTVLVISGDDDRIIPITESERIAEALPDARLEVVPACGHLPQEECPDAFLVAIDKYLQQ